MTTVAAHDPLTADHSERVMQYSLEIVAEMGLSDDHFETIGIAALLHDYGKLEIPNIILDKPGPLNFDELEIVKTHPIKTRHVLEQIGFEGIYSAIPAIAGAHHERLDGTGYPNGLSGEEIPLGARIIAVADFFEAMTTRRCYRSPTPFLKVFHMLEKSKGRHFDPIVVDAFMSFCSHRPVYGDLGNHFVCNA